MQKIIMHNKLGTLKALVKVSFGEVKNQKYNKYRNTTRSKQLTRYTAYCVLFLFVLFLFEKPIPNSQNQRQP
jgi:hypothetical protein